MLLFILCQGILSKSYALRVGFKFLVLRLSFFVVFIGHVGVLCSIMLEVVVFIGPSKPFFWL